MTAPEPVGLTDGEREALAYEVMREAGHGQCETQTEPLDVTARTIADALAAERAAREAQVQAGNRLREAVEALADEARARKQAYPDHLYWSAWDHYESDLRDALAAAAPTPPQDAATEGGR